jgi:hypothetical protein
MKPKARKRRRLTARNMVVDRLKVSILELGRAEECRPPRLKREEMSLGRKKLGRNSGALVKDRVRSANVPFSFCSRKILRFAEERGRRSGSVTQETYPASSNPIFCSEPAVYVLSSSILSMRSLRQETVSNTRSTTGNLFQENSIQAPSQTSDSRFQRDHSEWKRTQTKQTIPPTILSLRGNSAHQDQRQAGM